MVKQAPANIYDIIPRGVKHIICLYTINDRPKKFTKSIIEKINNKHKDIQRVIIVFQRGVPRYEITKIVNEIGRRAEEAEDLPDLHIEVYTRAKKKDMNKILKKASEDNIPIDIWNK